MANVAENEERYLRQILLLGKGGCLVLRVLVNRETAKDGRSLEDILRSSKSKLQKCLLKFQFNYIFPSSTDVNTDIETWDISLLISIILNVFGHVTQEEKDAIIEIREVRNNIQGHHASYSLEEGEYNDLRLELCENILKLSSDKTTNMKCFDIISYSGAGRLTSSFILKELNALHAFEEEQLSFLNEHFGEAKSKLESINEKLNEIKADVNTVIGNQHEHKVKLTKNVQGLHVTALSTQADVAGIKDKLNSFERIDEDRHEEFTGHLQRIHTSTDETKQDVKEIKGSADKMEINQQDRHAKLGTQLQVINAGVQLSQQALAEIKARKTETSSLVKKIFELEIRDLKRKTENDLFTIIKAECDHKEKEKKALDVLFDFVKMIQNQNDFTEQEIKHNIEQRIRWHGDICLQLIDDLVYWFSDMYNIPNAIPGAAQLGSIQIPIKCSSVEGLLKQMEYMDSVNSKERLSKISNSLSKIIGFPCSLSWTIVPDSLQNLMIILLKDLETSNLSTESEKIVLPFQCKSLNGLSNIWTIFEGNEVNEHLARASKTLSKIVGADISLTTSVVKEQFTMAVYKMNKGTVSSLSDTKEQEREQRESMHDDDSLSLGIEKNTPEHFLGDKKTKKSETTYVYDDDFDWTEINMDEVIDYEGIKKRETCSVYADGSQSFEIKKNPFEYSPGDEETKEREKKSVYGILGRLAYQPPRWPTGKYQRHDEKTKKREKSSVYDDNSQTFGSLKNPFRYSLGDLKTKEIERETVYDDEGKPFELKTDKEFELDDEGKPFEMKTDKVVDLSDDMKAKERGKEVELGEFLAFRDPRKELGTNSEQEDERHLKFKYVGEYLVKCGKDIITPFITGIELLPNGRILLTDMKNTSLKMLDKSFNVVSYCDLPDKPCCVRYIGNDTAAVGLVLKRIVFVRVSGDIVIERFLEPDCNIIARSLAFYGETLYICDNAGTVYTSTTDGQLQRVLYKTQSTVLSPWSQCIDISDDGEMIYLTSYDKGLVTIDKKGNHLSTLRSDTLRRPFSVCTVGDGTIFVRDTLSRYMYQADYAGKKVLNVVELLPDNEYYAMCYDRKHSRLIVGCQNEKILVLELQK